MIYQPTARTDVDHLDLLWITKRPLSKYYCLSDDFSWLYAHCKYKENIVIFSRYYDITHWYVNQGNLVGLEGKAPGFFFQICQYSSVKNHGDQPKKIHQDIFISFKVIHRFVFQRHIWKPKLGHLWYPLYHRRPGSPWFCDKLMIKSGCGSTTKPATPT